MKTKSNILNKEFDFKVHHVALIVSDDLWLNDKWMVIINGQTFDYHTGIGHREPLNEWWGQEFNRLMSLNPKKDKANLTMYASKLEAVSKPKPLNIDDVLYSLVLDSQLSSEDFEDFCANLGYDEDSRKAEEIYRDCRKNAKKVKTFINNLEEAYELFQDY